MARPGNRTRPGGGKAPAAKFGFDAVVGLTFGILVLLSVAGYPESKRWLFIAVTAALAMLDGVRRIWRDRALTVDLGDAILAALIAFGALSLFWSANRNGGIQTIIIAGAMFALIAYVKRGATDTILMGISIGVGISALAAIATNMWLPTEQFSGFANSGYAAEALLLCIPFQWPLWRIRKFEPRAFAAVVVLAVAAYIVIYTPSMIGFFVVGMFVAIASLVYSFRRSATLGWACVAAWLILPLLVAWLGWDQLKLTSRLLYRTEIWLNAGLMAADRPLFGHGLGSFIEVFPLYKEAHGDLMPFVNQTFESYVTEAEAAHNEPVQLVTELGLAGLLPFLALVALTLRAGVRRLATDPFAAAGTAAVITVVGESLLEYPFQRAASLLLAVLAFAFAARGPDSGLRQWRLRLPAAVPMAMAPAALAVAALLIFASVRQDQAERRLEATRLPGIDPALGFDLVYQAHLLDPLERRIRTTLPIMLDGMFRTRGLGAVPQSTIDQVYGWVENGGHNNTAALVAHAQMLLARDGGNDPDFPQVLAALKRGSARVAAAYAIEARYQIGQGQYPEALATITEGLKYTEGSSSVPGADAAIKANLENLERIVRIRMLQEGLPLPAKKDP